MNKDHLFVKAVDECGREYTWKVTFKTMNGGLWRVLLHFCGIAEEPVDEKSVFGLAELQELYPRAARKLIHFIQTKRWEQATMNDVFRTVIASSQSVHIEPVNKNQTRIFSRVELVSMILPRTIRTESFEPAYNDLKGDFVKAFRQHKSKGAHCWLKFCFTVQVVIMFGQCFWLMCSGKVKRAILRWLPPWLGGWGGG